ncbi:MAG TPA: hypothetical protein VMM56_10990, partial [Planctomycetaceae bacterium]|nr:hypothetical protein [Planctomycetaceae bacterium]
LVWQDLFFVGLATVVSVLHRGQPLLLMLSIFLTCYLVVWCFALMITGQTRHAYAIALGLSGLLFVWPSPIGCLILFGVLYAIARSGIVKCFHLFADWSPDPWRSCNPNLRALSSQQKQRDRRLGWPYDVLSPKRIEDSISVGWSAALGILVGWWCFALVFLHVPAGCQDPLMAACLIAIIVGGVRLLAYLVGSAAPLSIRGRVLNHRWILPRYDVVLIAPLLIVLLALTMISISSFPWIPVSILTAIVAGGSVFISLACPPGLEEWKLTGSHRIVPGIGSRISEYVETP